MDLLNKPLLLLYYYYYYYYYYSVSALVKTFLRFVIMSLFICYFYERDLPNLPH